VAYLANDPPGFEVRPLPHRPLSSPTAARASSPRRGTARPRAVLLADGKTLYGTAMDVGHVGLFAIDVAGGKVSRSSPGLSHAPAGPPLPAHWPRLVFGLDSLTAGRPLHLPAGRPRI